MWHGHDGPDGWGWLWMLFAMALLWIPLLLAGVWLLLSLGRQRQGPLHRDEPPPAEVSARELARRAYARGEIDRERFLQTIADLDQSERPPPAP